MIRRFARPYAKAMMDIVKSPEEGRKLHGELLSFERARSSSTELAELFATPAIEAEKKVAVARAISSKIGLSDISTKLVDVLVRHHRINQLSSVLEAWKAMIDTAMGVSVAEVRSAHDLSEAEQGELRRTLEAKFDRKIELQLNTDPALLGGFVAKVGSEVYDASVKGQLQRFRESLT